MRNIPPNPDARYPLDWTAVKSMDLTKVPEDRLIASVGWCKHLEWMRQCEGDYAESYRILSARVQLEGELERREPTPVLASMTDGRA